MNEIKKDLEHTAELLTMIQDVIKSEFELGDKTNSLWKIYENSDEAYYSIRLALKRLQRYIPEVHTEIIELKNE